MNENLSVKERLKKLKLTENIGLKILALIISFVLWIVVVSITDPVVSQTFRDVNVKLTNTSIIKDEGKTIEVLNGTDIIESITIKAPRSVVRELGNSNDSIEAIADFSKLSEDQTHVPIAVNILKYSDKIESIKASGTVLDVNVENKITIQIPITATTSGEVSEGYVIGKVTTAQNQIKISGPESIISTIKSASVDVQVTGFTDDISAISEIALFDSNHNIVSDPKIEVNIDTTRVDVEILATKTVPVNFSVSGTPAEGYALTGEMSQDVNEVVIAGRRATLNTVSAINIPGTVLSVTGHSDNLSVMIDVEDYLASGLSLGDPSFNGKITATVYIEELKEQVISVFLKNVDIQSGPDGFDIEWAEENDYIEFTIVGLARDLEKVALGELDYHVDFGDYSMANNIDTFKAGIYNLSLNLNLPDKVEVKEPVTIKVSLKPMKSSAKTN